MTNTTRRRRIKTGDEQDAYTDWRQMYVYLSRPKVVVRIKRRTHKRERHGARLDVQEQWDEAMGAPGEPCRQTEGR